jgi:excisionase family DNA binding protein
VLGRAVVANVAELGSITKSKSAKRPALLKVEVVETELLTHIMNAVVETLLNALYEPNEHGKAFRMSLIAELANAESRQAGGAESVKANAALTASDDLLTTADVASRLDVSRPHVSMLCDAGKLGEVVLTEGGHRRIRSSAVDAYLAARVKQSEDGLSPREAAVEAGLYDYPEEAFQNKTREDDPARSIARKTRKRS